MIIELIEFEGEAALPLPPEVLKQLGLGEGSVLDCRFENGTLILTPRG